MRDGKVKLWRFNPLTQANESITLYVSFFRAHYRAVEVIGCPPGVDTGGGVYQLGYSPGGFDAGNGGGRGDAELAARFGISRVGFYAPVPQYPVGGFDGEDVVHDAGEGDTEEVFVVAVTGEVGPDEAEGG